MFAGLKCADLLMRFVLKPTFVEVCDGIQTYRLSPEFLFRPAYSSLRSGGPPSPRGKGLVEDFGFGRRGIGLFHKSNLCPCIPYHSFYKNARLKLTHPPTSSIMEKHSSTERGHSYSDYPKSSGSAPDPGAGSPASSDPGLPAPGAGGPGLRDFCSH